ncbi:MAG: hypothetical protein K9J81_10980 [Desulfohalobiaceae bacterium]|nr:hypothetical protein [Desulfohalobiaceae bacterium]
MGEDGPGLDAVSKEAQPPRPESRHKTSHETQGDIFDGSGTQELCVGQVQLLYFLFAEQPTV